MYRVKCGARVVDIAILVVGVSWFIFLLSLATPKDKRSYLDLERGTSYFLRHGHYSDLTQDVIGFRAIWDNQNAYPVLGPAMFKLGVSWDIKQISTHPPTAFLLVGPVAWMPINTGARVWAWMMVACMIASFFFVGCNALQAVGLGLLSFAWVPVGQSVGQLTPIWLLGVSAAYKFLPRSPMISGAVLAIAAATKLAPAIMLALVWRRPKVFIGFAVAGIVLLVTLLALSPSSITTYLRVNKTEVPKTFGRPDNGSIIARASHSYGKIGRLGALLFLAIVAVTNLRQILRGELAGWSVLSYLAVAALPILWVYSLVPLLFLGRWAMLSGWMPNLFFFSFILMTAVLPVQHSPMILAGTVVWLGIGFIVTALMSKTIQSPATDRAFLSVAS